MRRPRAQSLDHVLLSQPLPCGAWARRHGPHDESNRLDQQSSVYPFQADVQPGLLQLRRAQCSPDCERQRGGLAAIARPGRASHRKKDELRWLDAKSAVISSTFFRFLFFFFLVEAK